MQATISTRIETSLAQLELQLGVVSAALIDGDPQSLESVTADLRRMSMGLYELSGSFPQSDLSNKQIKLRLAALTQAMAEQREGLSRRIVAVDRALSCMLPDAKMATYAQASSPYGSAGRQSGAFKLLAA